MGQLTKNEIFALAVQRYSDTVFRAAMHNCCLLYTSTIKAVMAATLGYNG